MRASNGSVGLGARGRRHGLRRWHVGAGLVVCVALGAGIAVADIPDGNTINACRNNTTFALRVIDKDASQSCTASETALSWTSWKWRGTWSAAASPPYAVGDAVSYLGSSYLATAVPGATPPTNAANWGVLAAAGLGTVQLSKAQIARLRWDQNPARAAKYTVGSQPEAIAFDGTNIWVTNINGVLSKIVPATGVVTTPVTGRGFLTGIAFDGTNLWVGDATNSAVLQISTAGTVLHTVSVPGPGAIAFDGTKIWVASVSPSSTTVSRINRTGTPAVDATVTVGTAPFGLVFDGAHLWVTNSGSNTVSEINPATATTIGSPIAVGTFPHSFPAFDGTNVWVPNTTAGTVSKINVATATVTATITIGAGTKPSAAVFDGTHVWIANNGANTISKIDPTTNTVTTGGDGFTMPGGMAFDGSDMWIPNAGSNTVLKVPAP
jgi:YVTN family beta-propeller protein